MFERSFFFSYSFLTFGKFITCLLEDSVEFVIVEWPCGVETLLRNKLYDEFTAGIRKQKTTYLICSISLLDRPGLFSIEVSSWSL